MYILNTSISMKNICCTCLSDNRNLLKLYKITDAVNLLYSLLCFDDEAYKLAFHKDIPSLHICWECRAIVRRTQQFRIQAARAFTQLHDIVEGRSNNKIKSQSNLTTHTTTPCNIIHEEEDNFIDCGVEINSEIDDDIPLSELKFENSEIDGKNFDYNFDYDILIKDIPNETIPKLNKRCNSIKNKVSDILLDNSNTDNQNMNDNSDCDNLNNEISDKIKIETKSKHNSNSNKVTDLLLDNSNTAKQNINDNSDCDNLRKDIADKTKIKKKSNNNKNKESDILLDNSDTDNRNVNDNSDCDKFWKVIPDKPKIKAKKKKINHNKNKVSNEIVYHDDKMINELKCKTCGIGFKAQNYFDKHYLKCHKKKGMKYPCRVCELKFDDAKQRWRHVQKTHNEKHRCSVCTKSFSFRSNLLKHEKNHTSPPPREKCLVCHKIIRFDLAKTHSLTHTDRQTYTCVSCDKRYVCKDTYDNHMKYSKAHATVDLKRYKCQSCDKRYRYQSELRDHVNYQHKSQTEHKCPICEKGYATKRCVNRHIKRAHEGIKENTGENICQRCGKSFTERKRLLEHERIHSGSRPLSCELCGHTFRQRASLYTHRKRVHKLVIPHRVITVLDKNS